jgi:hypothetical protein
MSPNWEKLVGTLLLGLSAIGFGLIKGAFDRFDLAALCGCHT